MKVSEPWSAKFLHRPQKLEDFIGQETVIDIIKGQLKTKTLTKSYIITGPYGSGKTSLARIIAKLANNTDDDKHPNIRLFKGTVQSGIDDIRALLDSIRFAPFKNGKLVIIIEEAHGIYAKSADALLVDLENPPDHVMFILVTNEPHKLKSTILDRCKKLELKPLNTKNTKRMLLRAAKKEDVFQSSKYEIIFDKLSQIYAGRNRDALNSLSNLVDISKVRNITEKDIDVVINEVSGLDYKDIPKFLSLMYNHKPVDAFKILNTVTDYNGFSFVLLELNTYLLKIKTGIKPTFNYGGNILVKSTPNVKVSKVLNFQQILIDMRQSVTQISSVAPDSILFYYAVKLGG